ncbi:hydrolase of HD superfamily [Microcystis phage vB_MweS-yong2]|nr:hydrolase of HD superfamily [Microcystis phage vB_MweS-yong2]
MSADPAERAEPAALCIPERPYTRLMRDGALVDIAEPDWRAISLPALALQLADINRWSGALSRPVSDAEHSIMVWRIAPAGLKLAALLHDGHEAVTCDLPRPEKRFFADRLPGFAELLDATERRIDIAIAMAAFAHARRSLAGERLAAEAVADQMREPALKAADERAALAELHAFGPRGFVKRAGYLPGYAATAPEREDCALRWLDLVTLEARGWAG